MGMTQEETLLAVINDVEALGKHERPEIVRKWASYILSKADTLKEIDGNLFNKFQNALTQLSNLVPGEIENISSSVKVALENLELMKLKLKTAPRNWLKADKPKFTEKYNKAKESFRSNEKAILATEEKILEVNNYVPKLHGPISSGTFEKSRHARVTGNLRIYYHVEGEFVVFDDILTKNEFDKIN